MGLVKNDNLVKIGLQENRSLVHRFFGSSVRALETVEITELKNGRTEEPGNGEREARTWSGKPFFGSSVLRFISSGDRNC
jgi:hypothetical protein